VIFFKHTQCGPKGTLDVELLALKHGFGAEGMSDAAAEAERTAFLRFPKSAMTFRAGEGRKEYQYGPLRRRHFQAYR
jgi:hypothetical protein